MSNTGAASPVAPSAPEAAGSLSGFVTAGLRAVGPDRKRLALTAGLAFLIGILETALLYLIAAIAVAMTNGSNVVERSIPGPLPDLHTSTGGAVLVAGAILLLAAATQVPLARNIAGLSARASARMRNAVLKSYLSATTEYRATHKEGYLAQLVGEYCTRAEAAVQQLIIFIVSICTLSVFLVGAVAGSPLVALVAVVAVAISALVLRPFAGRVRRHSHEHATITRAVVSRTAQATRLSQEIVAFDVAPAVAGQTALEVERASEHLRRMRYDARLVPSLYQYGAIGVVLALIGVLSLLDPGSLTGVAPLILLMIRAVTYVRQLIMASRAGLEVVPYLAVLQKELADLKANEEPRGGIEPQKFAGLRMDGVGFAYGHGTPVLAGLDLVISPGEMLGVIGPSGSGKSTLSQLILRLLRPTAGRISTGGLDLWDVSPSAWSLLAAYVPQESKLAYATVAENIRFFRDGVSFADIEAAARSAHIHDELRALPQGYDTVLGPGARDLSGGQRQRLAIARALLARPQLIVLDEPTSALDSRSEQLIGRTLEELKGTTTIVLIAHRPATLQVCDRVVQMTDRTVAEEPRQPVPEPR